MRWRDVVDVLRIALVPDVVFALIFLVLVSAAIFSGRLMGYLRPSVSTDVAAFEKWAHYLLVAAVFCALLFNRVLLIPGRQGYWSAILGFPYWLGQWLVVFAALAGVLLSIRASGLLGNWQAIAGLVLFALTVGLFLPDLTEVCVSEHPRTGIVSYVQIKRNRADIDRHHFTLTEPKVIGGINLPAGVRVDLDEQNQLVRVAADGKKLVVAGLDVEAASFYAGTSALPVLPVLKEAFLADDQEVQGIPCKKSGSFLGVSFFPSGKIRGFQLSKPHQIAGIMLPGEASVYLGESPNDPILVLLRDAAGVSVHGLSIPPSARFKVMPDGRLVEIDQPYNPPLVLKSGLKLEQIRFDEQGRPAEGKLLEDSTFDGKRRRRNEWVDLRGKVPEFH